MHVYHHHGSQKQGAVVFNVVGELKGVISDQGQFVSIDDLSEKEIVCFLPSLFFPSFHCRHTHYVRLRNVLANGCINKLKKCSAKQ
jgi:hypothetical protein